MNVPDDRITNGRARRLLRIGRHGNKVRPFGEISPRLVFVVAEYRRANDEDQVMPSQRRRNLLDRGWQQAPKVGMGGWEGTSGGRRRRPNWRAEFLGQANRKGIGATGVDLRAEEERGILGILPELPDGR